VHFYQWCLSAFGHREKVPYSNKLRVAKLPIIRSELLLYANLKQSWLLYMPDLNTLIVP
jgi:hypothetical protein